MIFCKRDCLCIIIQAILVTSSYMVSKWKFYICLPCPHCQKNAEVSFHKMANVYKYTRSQKIKIVISDPNDV